MRPKRVIHSTWLAALAVSTIGAIDGKHKLPAPKAYVAHTVLWGILHFLADTGLGKLAARLSMLCLLTMMILGPFGVKAIDFLNMIAERFAVTPLDKPATFGGPTEPGESPLQNPPQFA